MGPATYWVALFSQLPGIVMLLSFRALPPLLYLAVGRESALVERIVAATVLAAPFVLLKETDLPGTVLSSALILCCDAALACIVWDVARRSQRRPGLGTFGGLAIAFCLLPSLVIPSPYNAIGVVWGWEMTLSAFSYMTDGRRGKECPSLGDALFFIIVDPTFVYPGRSQKLPNDTPRLPGLFRICIGTFGIWANEALRLAHARRALPLAPPLDQIGAVADYAVFAAHYLLRGLGFYLSHSGLASVQIGLMRAVGFVTPERYVFPFLAASPQEFWQRFNRWVGAWVSRYVYYPFAHRLSPRRAMIPSAWGTPVALLVTFVAVGLLHDWPAWMTVRRLQGEAERFPFAFTFVFFVFALVYLSWWRIRRAFVSRETSTFRRAILVGLFVQLQIAMAWFFFPLMETGRFPIQCGSATAVRAGSEERPRSTQPIVHRLAPLN